MRKLKLFLVLLCTVFLCHTANADVQIGMLQYYLNTSTKTAGVYGFWRHSSYYESLSIDLVIPASVEYDGDIYTVTQISEDAFENTKIVSVTIPESVTTLGKSCFSGCSSLASVVINGSVTTMGGSCFSGCSSLTSVTISEGVTVLGDYCFSGCSSLTSITIPEGVTKLGEYCFYKCSSLARVIIPGTTTWIGEYCFYGCTNLKAVTCKADEEPLARSQSFPKEIICNAKLYVHNSALSEYKYQPWNEFGAIYPMIEKFGILQTSMVKGTTAKIYQWIGPQGCDPEAITWTSSDESIATVDKNGLVTALNFGSATITATTTDGSDITSTGVISVDNFDNGEWTEVTNSNIGSLAHGSVVKICPYGFGGTESKALSSSSTGGKYYDDILTSTEYAGKEGSNKWTLEDAGDGYYYLHNGLGHYWAFQQSSKSNVYMTVASSKDEAVKVKLVWNSTYSGVAFQNGTDETYLNNLNCYNYVYNWYKGSGDPLTYDSNSTYKVYVIVLVETVELNHKEATIAPGDSLQLTATVLPEDANNKNISWSSSDESVATVSEDGKVTAVQVGTATITASTTDGTNLSATCAIAVANFGSEEWTEVTRSNIGSLTGGSVIKICPYGYGGNESMALSSSTTGGKYYDGILTATKHAEQAGGNKWTLEDAGNGYYYLHNGLGQYWAFQQSSNADVYMDVTSSKLQAVKVKLVWNSTYSGVAFQNGTDGTYLNNLNAYNLAYNWYDGDGDPLTNDTNTTYHVYVMPRTVLAESVELDREEATLTSGKYLQLTATVLPQYTTNKNISWSSSDESIATVTSTGLVTAMSKGTAVITATTTDGSNLSASCIITVADSGSEEWAEVTSSNIGNLTSGSVIKIYPFGYGSIENMALSSSTTGGTYDNYILTSTEYAGQAGGNEWTLVNAGNGMFYLKNGVGLYWAFQQSSNADVYMNVTSSRLKSVKVKLVWNPTYSGVAFQNGKDGTYLNNLNAYNYMYNWYDGDGDPLTNDTNTTYIVYIDGRKASGIDGIIFDDEEGAAYYQLNGVKLSAKPQRDGIYIRVKDGKSQKFVVRR